MNTLAFEILPSESSNDHQARIWVDGEDWLGLDYLGIDPPHFFSQAALTSGGKMLVGRCDCGCEGCCDYLVDAIVDGDRVRWINSTGLNLCFNRIDYCEVVSSAARDFRWEDVRRTAERLVHGIFEGVSLDEGYSFDWASARIRDRVITLSFSKGGSQKTFEFAWDGSSPQDALERAKRFKVGGC